MLKEVWKDVPDYEDLYQVSNLGNIKSLSKLVKMPNNGFRVQNEKLLVLSKDTKGYYSIKLCLKGKAKSFSVHKLVAMAFLNHKPDGTQKIVVDHINNIRTDNRVENLQLISQRENTSKTKRGNSIYTGVFYSEKNENYKSSIRYKGKRINLGTFKTELEAYNAYRYKLKQINNEIN
jgi:hypothetical protein